MRVASVKLNNFRNYSQAQVEFLPGRNVITGENAQGKTNLLEAVELASTGSASRASADRELVLFGETTAAIEVEIAGPDGDQTVSIGWSARADGKISRQMKVNGVIQPSVKGLLGRLVTVSFSYEDLNLLRGSPRHRRQWLDGIAVRLRPAFHDTLASYARCVQQRNKLLKSLCEAGKVTVSDRESLEVWDSQLARYGAAVIKTRLEVLDELLPLSGEKQSYLSRKTESLSATYLFRSRNKYDDDDEGGVDGQASSSPASLPASDLARQGEDEIAASLVKLMKERRGEEIRRKASQVGPHRDDVEFKLNQTSACAFASQGQQRSVVLAMKLSELEIVSRRIRQRPVLLLDDVLAELDLSRQELLMGSVQGEMQTIVTACGLSVFKPDWLETARVIEIKGGNLAGYDSMTEKMV